MVSRKASCKPAPGAQKGWSAPDARKGSYRAASLPTLLAGLAAGNSMRRRAARSSLRRHAREIVVEVESSVPLSLQSGSVDSMDAFMAENATEVSLQNVQQVEDVGESGEKRCYLEPTDFGPLRTQMRLTVKVDLPKSGECDVNVLKMESGSVNGGRKKAKGFSNVFSNVSTQNSMSWKMDGNTLEVLYTTTAKSKTVLPFWFPLPDGAVKSLIESQIRRIISSGQEEVMENLKVKYASWQETMSEVASN